MGYETRMYVVAKHTFLTEQPFTGQEIAVLELCKCGDGPVGDIFQAGRDKAKKLVKNGKPYFAIWPRNYDRQREAVEVLREIAEELPEETNFSKDKLNELSNDIEDGYITKDCYDDYLGVNEIDEVIEAMEKETEDYRRFNWALALLKSIKENYKPTTDLLIVTYGH